MKSMAVVFASKRCMRGVAVAVISALVLTSSLGFTPAIAGELPSPVQQTNPGKPPSGVGKIELEEQQQVVLMVSGIVDTVDVEVGDQVSADDTLVQLDTQDLEWAVQDAEMALESARIQLAKLNETVDEIDIAQAEAQYLLAQENLAVVEAGPTQEQLSAAESSLAAAQAAYSELRAGPTAAQLTQAQASLQRAEIELQEAQRAYDQIAWRPDAGATSQSAALQQATISYEAAKAAYDETTEPAKTSELQSSLASVQRAQDALNELKKQPTSADLAAARANLADAEATLAELQEGPNENDLRLAEISVEQALTDLERARLDLENAEVTAPINGTVLAVNVEPGQQASGGTAVVTIADTSQLKLVVNVEQRDIPLISVGQDAVISVYALGNQQFEGMIDLIVPVSDESSGLVTYPVTVQITSEDLSQLLPGMTATATFDESAAAGDSADDTADAGDETSDEATATEADATEADATETDTTEADATAEAETEADAEATPEAETGQ